MTFVVSDNPMPLRSSLRRQQAQAFRRGWMQPRVAWPAPARHPRPAGRVRELTVRRRFVDSGVNRESPNPRPARLSAAQMDGFHFSDYGFSGASRFIPEIVTPESNQV